MRHFLNKYLSAGRGLLAGLALIIAAGGVMRVRYFNAESRHEVTGYYSLAAGLGTNGVLAYPGSPRTPSAYRAPLYPVFLSLFAGEEIAGMRAAFYAQLFLFGLTVLLVWAAAGLAAGSNIAALAAAAIYAFHPAAVACAASFEVEFFYGFLLAAAAAAMALAAAEKNGWQRWAPAFLLIGIAISCKSPAAFFPPLLAAWLYFSRTWNGAAKMKLPLLALLSYLAIVPWTARNAMHFRAFIPFERNAALCNIYTAGAGMAGTCLPSVAEKLYALEGRGVLYSPGTGVLSLLKAIVMKPGNYAEGFVKRLPLVFGTFPFLFICSAVGLWLLRRNEGMIPLGLLASYFAGVHLLFSYEKRYLLPALPVISVLAAAPAARLRELLRGSANGFDARPAAKYILSAAACVILPVYALSVYLLAAEVMKTGLAPLADDAVETLIPVVKTENPAELAAYYNQKGVLKLFSRDLKSAKLDFISAISADPRYPDPYLNLAYVHRADGEQEAALRVCRAAEEKRPAAAGADAYSDAMLAEILKCQETSLNSLGRKKEAGGIAARRDALERISSAEPGR